METSKLRKFAQFARRSLREQVSTRLKAVLATNSIARRESPKAVAELEKQIKECGEDQVIETAAYVWFNRFCALRFMDAHNTIKRADVIELCRITKDQAAKLLKRLVTDNKLVMHGQRRGAFYEHKT